MTRATARIAATGFAAAEDVEDGAEDVGNEVEGRDEGSNEDGE